MACRSEGGQPRVPEGHGPGGGEELLVLRVRAGPAALDVREARLVQAPGDLQLVGQAQDEALALRAVAQGRVVEEDRSAHAGTSAPWPMRASRKPATDSVPSVPPRSPVRGPSSRQASTA